MVISNQGREGQASLLWPHALYPYMSYLIRAGRARPHCSGLVLRHDLVTPDVILEEAPAKGFDVSCAGARGTCPVQVLRVNSPEMEAIVSTHAHVRPRGRLKTSKPAHL